MIPSFRLVHVFNMPWALNFIRGQGAMLKAQGIETHVVATPQPGFEERAAREDLIPHGIIIARKISPFVDMLSLVKLWRLFRRLKPAVIHTHTPKGGLLGTLAGRLAGVPLIIYHIHGFPFETMVGWKRILLKTVEKISCRLAHKVLCVSPSVRIMAEQENIFPAARIRVPLNGSIGGIEADQVFNPDRFSKEERQHLRATWGVKPEHQVIGYVGRLSETKGIRELNEAWKMIRNQYPLARLLLVGPEDEREPACAVALEELHQDPHVIMMGHADDLPPLFSTMDIFVLPSHREGLPVVILEASAMNLPVVATRVRGNIDAVVDGHTGILVDPYDPVGLAQALDNYVGNPGLRSLHGRQGRQRMLVDFRADAMWACLHDIYKGTPDPHVFETLLFPSAR